ncbi:MAG: 6-bladed beta-propeller [Lachnospiraceae bacterium]|nr:6-bladed beta-propeller [Lachnospiraceae bacterium]
MKHRSLFYFALGCMASFGSCGSKENTSPDGAVLTYVGKTDSIDAMTFLEPMQHFIIETTDESVIQGINRVASSQDAYYFLDKRSHKIVATDKLGNVKHVIDARGSGPLEYVSINDIAWDENSNSLIILAPKKLLYVDSNGKIFKDRNLEKAYYYISTNPNGIVLAPRLNFDKEESQYALTVIDNDDRQFEVITVAKDYVPNCNVNGTTLAEWNGMTIFTHKFDNKIYCVSDTTASVAYTVDWNGHEFVPEDGVDYDCNRLMKESNEKEQVFNISEFQSGEKYMLFHSNLPGLMLADKETGEIRRINHKYDTEKGIPIPVNYAPVSGDGSMVFFIYPPEYLKMTARHSKSEWAKEMAKSITEDSNPVILPYKLK